MRDLFTYLVYETITTPYLYLFLLRVLVTWDDDDRIPYFLGLGVYKYKKTGKVLCVGGARFKEKDIKTTQN